ncbi:progestin and adipoQ receptor family member 3 [Anoplophora glabripennis]|uniref:progestin and adipoQ receptor family member 3 n=1 Tax=Anoplophora glabripennis TaxID=217634 RepID=UPI0008749220|nr:progestin and adipoQ receptor family member 3 [Anoplophora glabripennis]
MTVTIVAKHEILATDDNGNDTCCTTEACVIHDHTQSLLEDLTPDTSSVSESSEEEVYEDELLYEKLRQLLFFEEAPEYMKHNAYILSGYRGILNTQLCVESLFWWTNETINIWSHIFGFVLFVTLTIYDVVMVKKVQAPFGDKLIVGSVLLCFQVCMALSSLYHTFSCRSEQDCHKFLSYDLFGIALSLLAIYTSGIYYAFWCDEQLQNFYLTTITIIFVIAMILQVPKLNIHCNIKMLVFVAWACYGVIPTIHWTIAMGGFENPVVALLFPRVLGMYAISGTAFLIYATKVPERFSAGKFDFIGHSHQWWHFFVVVALYYWHNTGLLYIDYRMNHGCPNTMRFP